MMDQSSGNYFFNAFCWRIIYYRGLRPDTLVVELPRDRGDVEGMAGSAPADQKKEPVG